jgi:extracellular elastinolytic metalloproteinase
VVTFDPADPTGDDQKVLNIFYYNCVMHDFFYLLGFREADGNFQRDNLGRGGLASDRVDARAHSGVVQGTANMATPMDGFNPIMNMGLVASTNRHTAFDSSVVYHEFTHGVTNRLVGGPANAFALEEHQSGGMGEGWSDYFACAVNETIVVGDWVVNHPGGIRGFPYDSNFPDNFGDLGTGRYSGFTPEGDRWPHPIGEIWCAALLEMNRNIGADLSAQLIVDALKLTPANPSFLDARNAILTALDDMLVAGQLNA